MTHCRCLVQIANATRCQHPKHDKYRLPVVESVDCAGCPLRVETNDAGEPQLPGIIDRLKTAAKDAVAIAGSGFATVSRRAYNERVRVCQSCPMYRDGRCSVCSCNIAAKAAFAVEQCPLTFWEHIPANVQEGDDLAPPVATPGELTQPYVEEAVYQARTNVCSTCEFRRGRRCAGCSCDIYTMARLTKSQCPKEKW